MDKKKDQVLQEIKKKRLNYGMDVLLKESERLKGGRKGITKDQISCLIYEFEKIKKKFPNEKNLENLKKSYNFRTSENNKDNLIEIYNKSSEDKEHAKYGLGKSLDQKLLGNMKILQNKKYRKIRRRQNPKSTSDSRKRHLSVPLNLQIKTPFLNRYSSLIRKKDSSLLPPPKFLKPSSSQKIQNSKKTPKADQQPYTNFSKKRANIIQYDEYQTQSEFRKKNKKNKKIILSSRNTPTKITSNKSFKSFRYLNNNFMASTNYTIGKGQSNNCNNRVFSGLEEFQTVISGSNPLSLRDQDVKEIKHHRRSLTNPKDIKRNFDQKTHLKKLKRKNSLTKTKLSRLYRTGGFNSSARLFGNLSKRDSIKRKTSISRVKKNKQDLKN